jgi:hypothetical protein
MGPKSKSKDISVPGRGGPEGCERLRLPHYLDKRLIYGGKVVSPTRRPHFTPRFFFLIFKDSWYSFLLEAESTPGPVRPEGLGQFKKSTSSGSWVLRYVIPGGLKIWLKWRETRNTYRILLQNVLEGSDRDGRVISNNVFSLFVYRLLTLPVIETI